MMLHMGQTDLHLQYSNIGAETKCLDNILAYIILNENVYISINMSLKFVPWGPINNIPALIQIMTCHRIGDKQLSESMMD